MSDGPGKTRKLRRAGRLEELAKSLGELYALDALAPSDPVARTDGDAHALLRLWFRRDRAA